MVLHSNVRLQTYIGTYILICYYLSSILLFTIIHGNFVYALCRYTSNKFRPEPRAAYYIIPITAMECVGRTKLLVVPSYSN